MAADVQLFLEYKIKKLGLDAVLYPKEPAISDSGETYFSIYQEILIASDSIELEDLRDWYEDIAKGLDCFHTEGSCGCSFRAAIPKVVELEKGKNYISVLIIDRWGRNV